MARPKKLNAEYFSHDVDMRNDVRIKALRRKYNHMGYAFWNMILEFLGDCDYFEYEWSELNIELLSADFNIDAKDIKEMVEYCVMLDLLQIEHNMLTCDKFTLRLMDTLNKKRDDFSLNNSTRKIRERDKANAKPETLGVSTLDNAQRKEKETKLKETKLNETGEEYRTRNESGVDHTKLNQTNGNNFLSVSTNEPSLEGDGSNEGNSVDSFENAILEGLQLK